MRIQEHKNLNQDIIIVGKRVKNIIVNLWGIRYKGQKNNKRDRIFEQCINNFNRQFDRISVYFYILEMDSEYFKVKQLDLMINKDYFHESFNATSLDVLKIIGIRMRKDQVNLVQYEYMELPFNQQGLVDPQENRFIKIEISKEGINESYQIQMDYGGGRLKIEIVQVFQKLSNIRKFSTIDVLDNYLVQLCRYENKNYFCFYESEQNNDVSNNAKYMQSWFEIIWK